MAKSPIDAKQIVDAIADRPITSSELLDMVTTGCTYEEARVRSEEQMRIRKAADAIEGLPLASWPAFDVGWDLNPASFYRVYDGADPASVDENELMLIVDVPLADIDAALTPYWRRTPDEVWTVGSPDKAARAIVHWSEGGLMTPPLLVPTSDGRLAIAGGNHRLAVARTKAVARLPILSKSVDEAWVREILKI
jgi:hypothetical protein